MLQAAVPRISKEKDMSGSGADPRHVVAQRYKTRLCRTFCYSGECPYEWRCMFAHGEVELRTMSMNLRDGLTSEEAIREYRRSRSDPSAAATSPCGTPGSRMRFRYDPYSSNPFVYFRVCTPTSDSDAGGAVAQRQ